MRFLRSLIVACVVWSLAMPAAAYQLSQHELDRLDAGHSLFKISPEMVEHVEELLAPFSMDDEVGEGYVFDGIQVDRFFVVYVFRKGEDVFEMALLPPVVEQDVREHTDSFSIAFAGDVSDELAQRLAEVVRSNDNGEFWPKVPKTSTNKTNQVAPGQKQIAPSQLLGDVILLMLFVFAVLGFGVFRQEFAGRSFKWWLALTGLLLAAFAVRLWVMSPWSEISGVGRWAASDNLPHLSVAWFLNTIWRFSIVDLGLITVLNVVAGTLTVGLFFMLLSVSFSGVFAPFVGAFALAVLPVHVALSSRVSSLIPFLAFLVALFLVRILYLRSKDLWQHLLYSVLFLLVLFARPEAIVFLVPLWLMVFLDMPMVEWKRLHFVLPVALQLLVLLIRAATVGSGPGYPDPFLSLGDFSVVALFANLAAWVFNLKLVPVVIFVLAGAGIAAKGWKRPRAEWLGLSLWLLLSWIVYYHVDLVDSQQGGRLSLLIFVPILWWTASGAAWLENVNLKYKRWIYVLVLLWLLLTPWFHQSATRYQFKASYKVSFLTEA